MHMPGFVIKQQGCSAASEWAKAQTRKCIAVMTNRSAEAARTRPLEKRPFPLKDRDPAEIIMGVQGILTRLKAVCLRYSCSSDVIWALQRHESSWS
jgi:hypothetical protein